VPGANERDGGKMSRRTFVAFGVLVAVLVVLVPWLAFRADGDSPEGVEVPAALQDGKSLFETNCGNCHTLYAAGTDGNFGPDLDELLAPTGPPSGGTAEQTIEATRGRVLSAVEEGVDSSTLPGRMPGGIISGEQAEAVAEFVARTAGQG
jgi:mono/diheme cytochrome c family protein